MSLTATGRSLAASDPAAPASEWRPSLALATAALMWAGNFIVGRVLGRELDPAMVNLLRWLVCLAAMLPWVGWRLWGARLVVLREWRLLVALSATGIVGYHTMVYHALASTTATSASLVLLVTPAAILLAAAAFEAQRPHALQWLGTALSVVGGGVLLTQGRLPGPAATVGAGELWMVGAVLAWAAYSLLLRRRPADLPGDVVLAASIVPAIAVLSLTVVLSGGPLPRPSLPVVAAFAYLGLCASFAAFLLWSYGVAAIGPARAGQYVNLVPVFGVALAVVLLGERVSGWQLAGAAFVFAGIVLGGSGMPAPRR